jgi:hypothetical protein
MNARQIETSFLRHSIAHEDSDERLKPEKGIAHIQRRKRCVQRFASVLALLPLLAIGGVGYETMSQKDFPYDGSHPGIRVLCEIGVASLVCLVALAGLLMGYHKKLARLREECPQLATRLLEPHWDQPDISMSPASYRGSNDREAFQGVAEVSRVGKPLAKWFKSIKFQVPEGYEDETGFHLGVDPRCREDN